MVSGATLIGAGASPFKGSSPSASPDLARGQEVFLLNQTPNPSIERDAQELSLLVAPHVKR